MPAFALEIPKQEKKPPHDFNHEVVFLFLRGVTLNLMTLAVQVPFFLPTNINHPIYILTSIIL